MVRSSRRRRAGRRRRAEREGREGRRARLGVVVLVGVGAAKWVQVQREENIILMPKG
jgi:hypothetical protein